MCCSGLRVGSILGAWTRQGLRVLLVHGGRSRRRLRWQWLWGLCMRMQGDLWRHTAHMLLLMRPLLVVLLKLLLLELLLLQKDLLVLLL